MLSRNMRQDLSDAAKNGPSTPFRIRVNGTQHEVAVENPKMAVIAACAGVSAPYRVWQDGREVTGKYSVWLREGAEFEVKERDR